MSHYSLVRDEYVWRVNDRSGNTVMHFTNHEKAAQSERTVAGQTMEQVTLYRDSYGRYYEVEMKEVDVDIPNQSDVLSKLTLAERKSLGFR